MEACRGGEMGTPALEASASCWFFAPHSAPPCPFCHNATLQHYRFLNVTKSVTRKACQANFGEYPFHDVRE